MQRDAHVVSIDAESDPRWRQFVSTHPDGLVYHHPAWMAVLRKAYGYTPCSLAYEDPASHIRGVLPLARSRGLITGTRIASLPRTPVAGPLAADDEADAALVRAAVRLASESGGKRVELRLPSARFGPSIAGALAVPGDAVYVLELPDDPEHLRFGASRNHARVRWAVKKAERLGVRVREATGLSDLQAWYPLYLETMRDHFRPPVPYRFFKAMWDELSSERLMRLLLAEQNTNGSSRLIAGSIFLGFGRTVTYAFNGRRRADLSHRPNDVIQWVAIHDACAHGFRFFDFGEVASGAAGLAQFKAKWGAKEEAPHRYLYPTPRVEQHRPGGSRRVQLGRRAWRNVPLRLTAGFGYLVYRYG
jgi:CelD/BcsL family acetyltransferase involved in cellulose biosynthesis